MGNVADATSSTWSSSSSIGFYVWIDSVAVDGKVNGSINLRTINNKTLPIANMTINYFSINDDL